MTGGQPGGPPAPAHVVLRRSISAGLAGALPLGSPLWSGIGFKLVVHVSHNAGVPLTVTVPRGGAARPRLLRVMPGARWRGRAVGKLAVGGSGG